MGIGYLWKGEDGLERAKEARKMLAQASTSGNPYSSQLASTIDNKPTQNITATTINTPNQNKSTLAQMLGLDTEPMQTLFSLLGISGKSKSIPDGPFDYSKVVPGTKAVYMDKTANGTKLTYDIGYGQQTKMLTKEEIASIQEILKNPYYQLEERAQQLGDVLHGAIVSHQTQIAFDRAQAEYESKQLENQQSVNFSV